MISSERSFGKARCMIGSALVVFVIMSWLTWLMRGFQAFAVACNVFCSAFCVTNLRALSSSFSWIFFYGLFSRRAAVDKVGQCGKD